MKLLEHAAHSHHSLQSTLGRQRVHKVITVTVIIVDVVVVVVVVVAADDASFNQN